MDLSTAPRSRLATPAPAAVEGIESTVRVVDGPWLACARMPEVVPVAASSLEGWTPVTVPGELTLQGVEIDYGVEAAYVVDLDLSWIPGDAQAVLRFDGVYTLARVWVEGELLGTHRGGFTSWEVLLPSRLRSSAVRVCVGVTDDWDEVSLGSRYAMHPIGGILRPPSVVVLPRTHLTDLQVVTDLVGSTGTVTVKGELSGGDPADVEATLMWGPEVVARGTWRADGAGGSVEFEVPDARTWSAEMPHLYDLLVEVDSPAGRVEYRRKVGIRTVRAVGDQLLVNDRPVRLRGINRHDMHPTLGRISDGKLERSDLILLKQANCNFVRTSHYPPHPALLEAADEVGMYLELETPVCWAGAFDHAATQDSEDHRDAYLDQATEMILRDRSHASVIMWSLGNESEWGRNFADELDLVRDLDPTRPVIMSFESGPEDILSSHYPQLGASLGGRDRPVIHDEYLHVPAYDADELRRNPAKRADWGEDAGTLWNELRTAQGALGGAVWAAIDEQFLLADRVVGWGAWGIVDVWRRRKPEFYGLRQAYSPVRLATADEGLVRVDGHVELTVDNDHDHLDLALCTLVWRVDDGPERRVACPPVPPRGSGSIVLPLSEDEGGVHLVVGVDAPDGLRIVDVRYPLTGAGGHHGVAAQPVAAATVREVRGDEGLLCLDVGGDIMIEIGLDTGRVRVTTLDGSEALSGGPRLHVGGSTTTVGRTADVQVERTDDGALVRRVVTGGPVDHTVELRVLPGGVLDATVVLHEDLASIGRGLFEAGIIWDLPSGVDSITWHTESRGSVLPDDQLARSQGTARRSVGEPPMASLADPGGRPWKDDEWDPALDGLPVRSGPSRDFRTRREGLLAFTAGAVGGPTVVVEPLGRQAARVVELEDEIAPGDSRLTLRGSWLPAVQEPWLKPVEMHGTEISSADVDAGFAVDFEGTGIEWIGARSDALGAVEIRVDGVTTIPRLDPYSSIAIQGSVLFAAAGLAHGQHHLDVRLRGDSHLLAKGARIVLESLRVLHEQQAAVSGLAVLDRWGPSVLAPFWRTRPFEPMAVGAGTVLRSRVRIDPRTGG